LIYLTATKLRWLTAMKRDWRASNFQCPKFALQEFRAYGRESRLNHSWAGSLNPVTAGSINFLRVDCFRFPQRTFDRLNTTASKMSRIEIQHRATAAALTFDVLDAS
jgi:hypothetical protein